MLRFDPIDVDAFSDEEDNGLASDAYLSTAVANSSSARERSVSTRHRTECTSGSFMSTDYLLSRGSGGGDDDPQLNSASQMEYSTGLTVHGNQGASRSGGIYRVSDSIFLGSSSIASQAHLLRRHGITHLLCCAKECPVVDHPGIGFTYIPLVDRRHDANQHIIVAELADDRTMTPQRIEAATTRSPNESGSESVEDEQRFIGPFGVAAQVLHRLTAAHEVVMVYCQRGVSRSPSVVMAHYIASHGLNFDAALMRVRAACPRADPNAWFCSQLIVLASTLSQ